MATWTDRCESIWLDATLAAVLVTGFPALAMLHCRQPARRRTWGRLGLAASLALVPLAVLSPVPPINIRSPTFAIGAARSPVAEPLANPAGDRPPQVPALTEPSHEPEATSSLQAQRPWSRTVLRGLLLAYGCGLALGLSRLTLGVVAARHLVRQSRPASDRATTLLAALPFAGKEARRPRLRVSDRSGRPVLVGFWRSIILIPPGLDRLEAEPQLRLGLLHELAHAEAGDHRFSLVAALAHATWFFLPQVWWVRGQLRLDAEFLADHRAVGHFGTSFRYAESLVGLALAPTSTATVARPVAVPASPHVAGSFRAGAFASALSQRVQMLLKCPFVVEDRPPRAWSVLIGCAVVGLTLGASSLSIRQWWSRADGLTVTSVEQAFHLGELLIAPQLADDRPFDLRFRLPDRFRLACEVLAEPAELGSLEILGYRLGPTLMVDPPLPANPARANWRRVEIVRAAGGLEAVHVDGSQIVPTHRPANPPLWLTIRPVPGRTTRVRDLHLTW